MREKILVIDSCEKSRVSICNLLAQNGYSVYEGKDPYKALRVARQVLPDLVVANYEAKNGELTKVLNIIESDKLSTILFVTDKLDVNFLKEIEKRKIYAYIMKPIEKSIFYSTVKFVLENGKRIKELEKKVQTLENNIEKQKIIEDAKIYLIRKWNLTEDQAYKLLRKRSMDGGLPIEEIAKQIME